MNTRADTSDTRSAQVNARAEEEMSNARCTGAGAKDPRVAKAAQEMLKDIDKEIAQKAAANVPVVAGLRDYNMGFGDSSSHVARATHDKGAGRGMG